MFDSFVADLGAKNGVAAASYVFKVVTASSFSGSYSSIMVAECAAHGMKPVCDSPVYCQNNAESLYIGQGGHIAYPPHRNTAKWDPLLSQSSASEYIKLM